MAQRNNSIKARTRNNYFTQQLQRDKNFIENMNIQQLQNDAPRILRDIAKGTVDINQCQQFLLNDRLINVLEDYAYQTLIYNSEISNSIEYRIAGMEYNRQTISPFLIELMDEWRMRRSVYEIIYTNIQNFKVTKDINYIIAMASQISRNRRYI